MLSAYRVIDATDHRGQLAGMILAGLGAEVVLAEPPEGAPHRARGNGLEWFAYNRGKQSVVCANDDAVLDLVRTADVLLDNGQFDRAAVAAVNPGLVHVTISAFGIDGPKADWAASDITVLAAGCAQALNGDSDRAPVRTAVPQGWLHAGAEAAVGALLALAERANSSLGQHVDVSAQQAVMQAGIPGVLLAPNDNAESQRTSGGILTDRGHLQFVYPAADGFVSITLLFGTMIGPFTQRLMQWVYDEGHCDEAMRDRDWSAFGLRLMTSDEGPAELEDAKAAIGAMTRRYAKADLFAEAQRRRVLLAPVATAAELIEMDHLRQRGYWEEVDGRTVPGPFVKSSAWPMPTLSAPPALGEHRLAERSSAVPPAAAPSPHSAVAPALPLAGLNVIDLTWVYAGPLATRVLADFGATVIKVEGPGHPDASRGGGGHINGDLTLEGSVAFAHFNAGKLGLSLDLTTEPAREALRDLVRWADVLVESYTPGVMDAWGLGFDALREINPRLVMLSTSLMGQTGPLSKFAGFGNLAGAISGFYEVTGWPDRAPAGPFLAYTDYVAPKFTMAALLAALEHRRTTGCGQYLDLSQAEASIHFLAPAILDHVVNGANPTRMGNADQFQHPHGVYPCTGDDCWVAIACETDEQRTALAAIVGELSDDALAAWTSQRAVGDIETELQAVGVPVHGVQNSAACYADPQLQARGHFLRVAHPVHGECVIEGPRVALSRTPAVVHRANAAMGEHNDHVLRDLLGYDDDKVTELVISGALG